MREVFLKFIVNDDGLENEIIEEHPARQGRRYLTVKLRSFLYEIERMRIEDPEYLREFYQCSASWQKVVALAKEAAFVKGVNLQSD